MYKTTDQERKGKMKNRNKPKTTRIKGKVEGKRIFL